MFRNKMAIDKCLKSSSYEESALLAIIVRIDLFIVSFMWVADYCFCASDVFMTVC
jgi:hypothetical protein